MKKLTPKRVNNIFLVVFLMGLITGALGIGTEIKAMLAVGMIIMITSIILRLFFYCCPHCGKYLDRSTGEYCPYCGEKVNKI